MAQNITIQNISDLPFKLRGTGQTSAYLAPGDEASVDLDDPLVETALRNAGGRYIVVAASGNDESVVQTVTVDLDDAAIRALPTTPAEIVPAPGDGKHLLLINGLISKNIEHWKGYDNVAEVTDGSAFMALFYDTSTVGFAASVMVVDDADLDTPYRNCFGGNTVDHLFALPPNAGYFPSFLSLEAYDRHGNEGDGFFLAVRNTGDFVDADPGGLNTTATNVLRVTLFYAVVDLP